MKKIKNPTACVIIIGNEILSGRTLDTNKHYLCKELTLNGIDVIEARVIKDNKKEIINTVNEVREKYNYVFTTGGIGPTHDDITSISIANAFKVKLIKNKDVIWHNADMNAPFLQKLFEKEVPEIFDGLITIKKIVREPGERAKICVESYDDRIDPVGACVGMNGSRIHSIVRELQNENIDVINFTENTELYITRALSPAKITSLKIEKEDKRVSVYLKPDQVSLAIGKGGQNIKLASRLVDLEIDVFRELDGLQEEDVDLEEFSDEIEGWIIDELKRIGLDTAKAVLNIEKDDLLKRSDLEEETVDNVRATLQKEFE